MVPFNSEISVWPFSKYLDLAPLESDHSNIFYTERLKYYVVNNFVLHVTWPHLKHKTISTTYLSTK